MRQIINATLNEMGRLALPSYVVHRTALLRRRKFLATSHEKGARIFVAHTALCIERQGGIDRFIDFGL